LLGTEQKSPAIPPVSPRSGELARPKFGGEGGWALDGVLHHGGRGATTTLGDIVVPIADEARVPLPRRPGGRGSSTTTTPSPGRPAKSLQFRNDTVTSKMAFHN